MPRSKFSEWSENMAIAWAMWANVLSWVFSTFFPSKRHLLLPTCPCETDSPSDHATRCISIGRPGGLDQLRMVCLVDGLVTKGYNVVNGSPFVKDPPSNCVVLRNAAFSVNYADCSIRWGLYESANKFVGWPIVPGFDVSGVVEEASGKLKKGDRVFGCTLFGAYSTRIAIPNNQLRQIPAGWTFTQAASLPAVSLTALYSLHLAGLYPKSSRLSRRDNSILIHSAAGGVGSMAVQMAKKLGLHPIVGVVGSTHKVEAAKILGCTHVIDKSTAALWTEAERLMPEGYATIMDANGVSTLKSSYDHLCPTGRLIVFGFHSNLPLGQAALHPVAWLRMAQRMTQMPKFDPMDLVVSNKSIMGFNLSFFSKETELVSILFDQVCDWVQDGSLKCPRIVEFELNRVGEAHELIMSGKSVGKVVISTGSV